MRPLSEAVIARFHANYIPVPEAGCWLWTASTCKGYGQLHVGGSGRKVFLERAHRISWAVHRGDIPSGMFVCHKCDTRGCVNPDHLFLGTCAENTADMCRKGRGRRGDKKGVANGRAVLNGEKVRDIRKMIANGRNRIEIGEEFGVTAAAIYDIGQGRTWRHV